MAAFKKGDRVQFQVPKGPIEHGTVKRAGKKTLNVICDGGKQAVEGPLWLFQRSTKPRPVDPASPLDRWGIRGYKTAGGDETVRFTGTITFEGRPVITASNGGTGGSNQYRPYSQKVAEEGWRKYSETLYRDVEAAIKQFGGGVEYEVIDVWVSWKAESSAYQSFTEFLKEFRSEPDAGPEVEAGEVGG